MLRMRKKEYKLNHLLFMDDFNLFSKSGAKIDTLVGTVQVFNANIGMWVGLKNCGVVELLN